MPRPKGVPNKLTGRAKTALTRIIEGNAGRVRKIWREMATSEDLDDRVKAVELYAKLAEYVVPKLGRAELDHSGAVGVTWESLVPKRKPPEGEG